MTDLAAVPDMPETEEQLSMFEGLRVQRFRLAPGSVPEFACIDEANRAVELHVGDTVVIQTEVLITEVSHGAGFKGGIRVKPMDRVHHGKVLDGSQQIVHVLRAQ